MFINIHTHHPPQKNECTIQNLYKNFEQVDVLGKYSIGLHPWYINQENVAEQLQQLASYSTNKNVLAIGECGLDKVCQTNWDLQLQTFTAQVQLANEINKPLIIHCVRAYTEVLNILQQQHNKVPVIFHGFNKNQQLAKQITDKDYYLSFGKDLQQQRVQQVFATVPLKHILLETDDTTISIETIYQFAATALQIDTVKLSSQIQQNAVAIFGTDFTNYDK